jgi:peptidoglycan-associated lipoprotein
MSTSRNVAVLLLGLGLFAAGTACKKPAPFKAPEPQKTDTSAQDADQARRDEAARRKAEADRQQAEKDRMEAARKAEADQQAASKLAASKALQDIHFAYDDSGLSEAAKAQLLVLADFLKANPRLAVSIEGNCDERGTVEYNLALGERRSHEAFAYLKGLGVAEGRLSTVSFGKEKPVCTESVEACWSRNRRDHFVLKP